MQYRQFCLHRLPTVLKFQFSVGYIAMYDIVLLMVFQLVQVILQTTYFIQRLKKFFIKHVLAFLFLWSASSHL